MTGVAPVAFFEVSPLSPIAGQPATFDASGSSDPVVGPLTGAEYLWDFGDGTTTETAQPTITHTFAAAGARTVKLTVKNEGLASAPFEEQVNVQAATDNSGGGATTVVGGGSTSTPTPSPSPGPGPIPVPKPVPVKPKPTPLAQALAKCTKKKGKAKAQCVKTAKKKYGKKQKSKKH